MCGLNEWHQYDAKRVNHLFVFDFCLCRVTDGKEEDSEGMSHFKINILFNFENDHF